MDIMTYTLVNLPQVLIDGVMLGFVYAAIALGYTMVYGVLEFINFAHSEIFAIGAFVGVEMLIALNDQRSAGGGLGAGSVRLADRCHRGRHGRGGRHGCDWSSGLPTGRCATRRAWCR